MIRRMTTGALLLLWTAAGAQQPTNQTTPQASGSTVIQADGTITTTPASTTQPQTQTTPTGATAGTAVAAPAATTVATPLTTTAPAVLVVPSQPQTVAPPLGADLRAKIKEDTARYAEKSAAARRDFDARQAAEKKIFDATPKAGSYWENRRAAKAFRAAQAKALKEFLEEQEAKRKTYEWRFP